MCLGLFDDKTGTLWLNEVLERKCLSLARAGTLVSVSPLTQLMIPDKKLTLIHGNGVRNTTESTRGMKKMFLSNCAIFSWRLSDKLMLEQLPLNAWMLDICIILTSINNFNNFTRTRHPGERGACNQQKCLNLIFSKHFLYFCLGKNKLS